MRRAGWWILFVVLLILLASCALLVIVGVVETAGGKQTGGVGPAVFAIVFFLLIGIGLAALAQRVEHHVRLHHHPAGTRWGVPAGAVDGSPFPSASEGIVEGAVVPEWSPPAPTGRPVRYPGRSSRRWHSPVGVAFGLVALAAVAIGFPVGCAISFSHWRTSADIQDHGIHSTLTVDQVIPIYHSTRYGHYYTINLQGTLAPPAKGQTQTTVHTPHDDLYFDGQRLAVLVDPSDLSHAELPGQAEYRETGFVVILCFTVAIYLFGAWVIVFSIRNGFRRRVARFR